MNALIMVDVQNDFMPGGTLAVPDGDAIVPIINALQRHFDLIVATQDWHPHNHASFASNHEGRKPFDEIDLHGIRQTLWPVHCVQGSHGASFHPELNMKSVESVIRKGMVPEIDSYSAFFDNDHKKRTGLAGYLREREATNLFFCGLAADICVAYTIQDALELGFAATLIEDAVRPLDAEEFQQIEQDLLGKGAKAIHSAGIR